MRPLPVPSLPRWATRRWVTRGAIPGLLLLTLPLGVWLGERIHDRIDEGRFRQLVFSLLVRWARRHGALVAVATAAAMAEPAGRALHLHAVFIFFLYIDSTTQGEIGYTMQHIQQALQVF